jgi:hypothetical protein
MSTGLEVAYEGVSFANVRTALAMSYFYYEDMPEDEWRQALCYVVPMQHNWENPIVPGSQDTWIEFWIDEDDRYTQDANVDDANGALKVARVSLRFLGRRAEVWAKAFHHLTKRKSVPQYFSEYCNAEMLEYISPIVPINVDYFKVGNTVIAHDLSFMLKYYEFMTFENEPLNYMSMTPGQIG